MTPYTPPADVLPRLTAVIADALADLLDDADLTAASNALDQGDLDLHRDIDNWIHIRIGGKAGVLIRAHVLPPDPTTEKLAKTGRPVHENLDAS
ncbi:hypothetical protein GCM10022251_19620 [Phytohabitans flavus]|uniref:Uncharacterized protein n=1 Tax=Phytohabitans flavus TaxID=1076124 RepID=A0A6F8XZA3_9ACTN|nr:hypothetical protein [Phytohabitans flavus]BCB79137.1 hypothetical protein Pflav_055470 [Phytohabitans flavus]